MRVVVDTNVLVSGLLSSSGPPASVVNVLLGRQVRLLVDNRILFEYEDVLRREELGFRADTVNSLIDFIRAEAEYINAQPVNRAFQDKDDKAFYEVAVGGKADALVTGNLKHFPKEPIIQTPRQFIDSLD